MDAREFENASMNDNSSFVDMVQRIQAGESSGLETLSVMARERLYPYARRVLLDHDESEDVVQDVLITILQSLGTLKHPDRFWSWAFMIATNKMRERLRRRARRKILSISEVEDGPMQPVSGAHRTDCDHTERISRQELAERTQEAMRQLPDRQRMVLSLRFYENMPHRQIADVIGCTEMNARVTFFQAKRALVSRLRRLGIDKAALGIALGAFGHLTLAPNATAATVAVNSAALGERFLAGLLTAKLKAVVVVLVVLALGGVASLGWLWATRSTPASVAAHTGPMGIHFVHQSLIANSVVLNFQNTESQGAYEQWYQFPHGLDGPFLFRMQRWDPTQKEKLCWWVENENGSHYVHSGNGTIYLSNARLTSGNYRTRVLPTDSLEFCEFAQEMDGDIVSPLIDSPGLEHQRDPLSGRLVRRIDRRFGSLGPVETRYDYSQQDPGLFRSPFGMPVQDDRDAMHKRGWTLLTVSGELKGRKVAGSGCIPFTLAAGRTHPAWLRLSVDGETVAVDDGRQSRLKLGRSTKAYCGGSLFQGLGRPWIGFHTLDAIRRDAAGERILYITQIIQGEDAADLELRAAHGSSHYLIRYHIDLDADLINSIQFWITPKGREEKYVGTLTFTYAQDVPADAKIDPPEIGGRYRSPVKGETPGVLWLGEFAESIRPAKGWE